MKKLKISILFCVSLAMLSACANLERDSYVTIGAIGATANAAIGSYQTYTQTHPPTPAETATARKVVQTYVDAMESARAAVTAYKAGLVTAPALNVAMTNLTTASADLSKILIPLTTKP